MILNAARRYRWSCHSDYSSGTRSRRELPVEEQASENPKYRSYLSEVPVLSLKIGIGSTPDTDYGLERMRVAWGCIQCDLRISVVAKVGMNSKCRCSNLQQFGISCFSRCHFCHTSRGLRFHAIYASNVSLVYLLPWSSILNNQEWNSLSQDQILHLFILFYYSRRP